MVLSKCENYNVIAEIGIDLLLLLLYLSSTPPKGSAPQSANGRCWQEKIAG